MTHLDAGLALLRVLTGLIIFAHGVNHVARKATLQGAGRWFESLGLRPGMLHAWLTAVFELAGGALFALGLLTPLAGASIVGLMAVAGWVVHRPHGLFIVREGYEYVLVLALSAIGLSITGPGRWSLDHALGIVVDGWAGGLVAAGAGVIGAVALLVLFWRPARHEATTA